MGFAGLEKDRVAAQSMLCPISTFFLVKRDMRVFPSVVYRKVDFLMIKVTKH